MKKIEELYLILELLDKYELPLSPILDCAIKEKIEQLSTNDDAHDVTPLTEPKDSNDTKSSLLSNGSDIQTIKLPIKYTAADLDSLSEIEKKIVDIVANHNGIKTSNIASILDKSRKEVNHFLYGKLDHLVYQDAKYQWHTNKKDKIMAETGRCPYCGSNVVDENNDGTCECCDCGAEW